MCDTCGCTPGHSHTEDHHVQAHLLADNDSIAAKTRSHLDRHGIFALNLMSAPGSGKTSLIEATLERLGGIRKCAVIVGDLATDNDAARIRAHGVAAEQISTGTGCHLDARMVADALARLDHDALDILFIENVGNLVCPACFDLGQHRNVALLSIPEGDDKPMKYPVMFRAADLVLLTKRDLAPVLPEFDASRAREGVRHLGNAAPVLDVSARSGAGLDAWCDWLTGMEVERGTAIAAGV